jgi:uncharacterized repeat protein (TIGR01451 family)
VIDPLLVYSTYLGGGGGDLGSDIAVDASGNAYVTGETTSTNFPTTNPVQAANGGGYDAFVAKIGLGANLSITKTHGQATAVAGQPVTYTITVTNSGPDPVTGATVTDTVPAALVAPTWTCVGAGGGTCTAAGAGNINDTVNLPVGATVTYTLSATVSPTASTFSNTAIITAPNIAYDPNLANNTATDTDIVTCGSVVVGVPDGRLTNVSVASGATAWFGATVKIGNSYSVEFKNTTGSSPPGPLTVFKGDDSCNVGSTLTTNNTSTIEPSGTGGLARASFTATGTQSFFQALLVNTTGGPVTLTFGWSDTSLVSPAWTTTGSFDTYYAFQNTTGADLSGSLTLLDTSGAVVTTIAVSVPAGQTVSTNTLSLGVARNRTGTAKFTHNGPPRSIVVGAAIANFSLNPAYVQPVKFQAIREAR